MLNYADKQMDGSPWKNGEIGSSDFAKWAFRSVIFKLLNQHQITMIRLIKLK